MFTRIEQCDPTSTPCPNFVTLGSSTLQVLWACYDLIIKHPSKAETFLKVSVHSQLLQKYYSPAKKYIFVNYEIIVGCPKLGHITLFVLISLTYRLYQGTWNCVEGSSSKIVKLSRPQADKVKKIEAPSTPSFFHHSLGRKCLRRAILCASHYKLTNLMYAFISSE